MSAVGYRQCAAGVAAVRRIAWRFARHVGNVREIKIIAESKPGDRACKALRIMEVERAGIARGEATFADDAPNSSRSVLPLTAKLPPLGPAGPNALVLICKPRSAPAPARLALLPARSSIEEIEGNWIPLTPRSVVTCPDATV